MTSAGNKTIFSEIIRSYISNEITAVYAICCNFGIIFLYCCKAYQAAAHRRYLLALYRALRHPQVLKRGKRYDERMLSLPICSNPVLRTKVRRECISQVNLYFLMLRFQIAGHGLSFCNKRRRHRLRSCCPNKSTCSYGIQNYCPTHRPAT